MAYHYPIIFWNTANLIVDSGSIDDEAEKSKSTNYGKVATAIADMKSRGINVALPLINSAKFEFVPDEKNNRIIFSLKALCNVGDDTAKNIIANQPYNSFEDFCVRMIDTKVIKNSTMITLIKAGAFTELDNKDRTETMKKYITRNIFKPCTKLGMQQFNKLKELDLFPSNLADTVRIKNFKDYVLHDSFLVEEFIDKNSKRALPKCGYNDRYFVLDQTSMPFFQEYFSEDSVVRVNGEYFVISEKKFTKEWKKLVQPLVDWYEKEETLEMYNNALLNEHMKKYASGSLAKWEMDSLCFYYTIHELNDLNENKYGVVDFNTLSETPIAYHTYTRKIKGVEKEFSKYNITRIAGTVLDRDNLKHTVTVLTKYGVVNVKFGKGQFSFYNKRISENGSIVDDSWFKRGNKVIICGYRRDSQFFAYKYADTIYKHTCMKIEEMTEDGDIRVRAER